MNKAKRFCSRSATHTAAFPVELAYTIYDDIDTIARSAKIINNGTSSIVLQEALSACVDF